METPPLANQVREEAGGATATLGRSDPSDPDESDDEQTERSRSTATQVHGDATRQPQQGGFFGNQQPTNQLPSWAQQPTTSSYAAGTTRESCLASNASACRWEVIASSEGSIVGKWVAYEHDVASAIERGWQENALQVQFYRGGVPYVVDFQMMVQCWNDGVSLTERPIRRVDVAPCEKWSYRPGDASEATPESLEFHAALGHYLRLSGSTADRVLQVDVYKSPTTSAAFAEMKKEFQASGRPVNEIWVYHGTREANIERIMSEGFKVGGGDVIINNGQAYGKGVYAATGPRTPERYARDTNKIILARALPGHDGGISATADCDSWKPRRDYVVFRQGVQLLPVYVIHLNTHRHLHRLRA